MSIRDRIAAEKKAAQAILAKGEENVTDEELAELKSHKEEIERLEARVELFKGATDLVESEAKKVQTKGEPVVRGIGEFYVRSVQDAGISVLDTKKTPFETEEFKAATDTNATGGADGSYKPLLTEVDQQGVFPYQRPLTVADLFSQGTMTGNAVTISPGTMYGTLSKMEKDGLIAFYAEDQKRKLYQITDLGREVLNLEIRRIERLYKNSKGEYVHA